MEASAENGIKVIVLDRPNPNGHYVDGPVLENNAKVFVDAQCSNCLWNDYWRICSNDKW